MIIPRQKQFGLGFKKLGRLLKKSAKKDLIKSKELRDRGIESGLKYKNKEVEDSILKDIQKKGVRVKTSMMEAPGYDPTEKTVVVSKFRGSGTPGVAHEVGHAENDLQGGLSKRVQEKAMRSIETRKTMDPRYKDSLENGNLIEPKTTKAIKNLISDGVNNSVLGLEESRASKKALEILKEKGATKEEIKIAKDSLKNARDSYRYGSRSINKSNLGDILG